MAGHNPFPPKPKKTRRERILLIIEDRVSDILYYHRKEDDDLPVGAIEEAIRAGEITVDEMMHAFGRSIRDAVKGGG